MRLGHGLAAGCWLTVVGGSRSSYCEGMLRRPGGRYQHHSGLQDAFMNTDCKEADSCDYSPIVRRHELAQDVVRIALRF